MERVEEDLKYELKRECGRRGEGLKIGEMRFMLGGGREKPKDGRNEMMWRWTEWSEME